MVAVTIVVALLASPGTAIAGQAPAAPSAPATDVYLHTVVPGDTLIGLGLALLTRPADWRAIQRLNRVRNPRRLRPGSSLRIPVDLLRSLPGRADVDWVKGRVHVEDRHGPRRLALVGAQLEPGAAIETEAEAAIRLRLSGGAVVTVGGETSLTLVELRELPTAGTTRTHIDLQRGRLEHDVPPSSRPGHRYEISTPVVTTAVRGTGFRVGVEPAAAGVPAVATTEVTAGMVDVARAAERTDVAAGFGTRVREGEPMPSPRPLLPAPSLADVPPSLERLPVRIRWTPLAGAVAYRVEVRPSVGDQPIDVRRIAVPDASWPTLADGSYRLRVRGIDADGMEGFDAERPFDVDARPEPPIIRAPVADAVVYGARIQLAWTRPVDGTAFDVQVAGSPSFASRAIERTAFTATELGVDLPPGHYHWRVASRRGGERGPWGDAVAFELRPLPAAGPPAGVGALDDVNVTLRWPAGMSGDRYRVQVARDDSFTQIVKDTTTDTPSLIVERPEAATYFVRVAIVNAEGVEGPFGTAQSLTIPRAPRRHWWWLVGPAAVIGALLAAS